jgi:hypothetical protein
MVGRDDWVVAETGIGVVVVASDDAACSTPKGFRMAGPKNRKPSATTTASPTAMLVEVIDMDRY